MKKRILSMLLAITIVFTMLPLNAISSFAVACGDFYYELLEDNTVEITGYSGSESEVEIPATLDGYSVSSIRSEALDCDTIVNITVSSDNLNFVSKDGVLFNNDMTILLQYPVGNTRKSYEIPDTVKTIDAYSFYYCDALEEIIIPESVTTIGTEAFYDCTSLREVSIPSSVKKIGYNAFKGCLFSAINVAEDNSCYSSKDGVLFNKDATILIQYPSGKTATLYSIPNTVTNIYSYAFFNCTSLTEIEIPESVTTIGDYVFQYCTNLKSIVLPDSVNSIGEDFLSECTALEAITFGAGINTIDESIFNDFDSLKEINISENNAHYSSENGILFNKNKTKLIRFPQNSPITSYSISATVKTLGAYSFNNCNLLIDLSIPQSVSIVESDYSGMYTYGAFEFCNSLVNLYYKGTVDEWTEITFEWTSSNPMEYAENEYFNGELVTDVVLSNGITSICDYAFYGCDSLSSITIPNSVITIGEEAFEHCENLKNMYYTGTADDWVKISFGSSESNPMCYAENEYFNGKLVTNIVLTNDITQVRNYTFYGCDLLSSITIPDSVTSIGSYAFYNCLSLKYVFYMGDETQWGGISFGNNNSPLTSSFIHYNATGHTSTDWIVSSEPTCTIDGSKYRECSVCGVVCETAVINILGHTPGDWIIDLNPTCTKDGSKHKECTACGVVCETAVINELGHTPGDWIVDHNPTCITAGSKHKECTVCGTTLETETIQATGHLLGAWTVDIKESCTEEGSKHRECANCSYQETEAINASGHDYVDNFCKNCDKPEKVSTWMQDANGWYYYDADGYVATDRWICDNTGWRYVGANGYCVKNCWVKDDNNWCYIGSNGYRVTDQFVQDSTGLCYLDSNGYMAYDIWAENNGYWYYVDSTGYANTQNGFKDVDFAHMFADELKRGFYSLGFSNANNEFSGYHIQMYFHSNFPETFNKYLIRGNNDWDRMWVIPYDVYETEVKKKFNSYGNLRISQFFEYDVASDTFTFNGGGFGDNGPMPYLDFYGFEIQGDKFLVYSRYMLEDYEEGETYFISYVKTVFTYDGDCIKYHSMEEINSIPNNDNVFVLNADKSLDGWFLEEGHWYCYENGLRLINTPCDGYFLGPDGKMAVNDWGVYVDWDYIFHYNYYGPDGKRIRNTWKEKDGRWYYFDEYGNSVYNKWMKDSKGWCYLGRDGYMLTNAWVKDSVGWCYVGANGYCVTNCWKKDSKGWCYLDSNGRMATNRWIKDSVGWCYVGANGYCVTNKWVKDSKGWCYLDSNGRMVYNKWVKDSVGWCYVGSSGYMVTNQWLYSGGKWYYLDGSGYMAIGATVINGKIYKFDSSGVWIG